MTKPIFALVVFVAALVGCAAQADAPTVPEPVATQAQGFTSNSWYTTNSTRQTFDLGPIAGTVCYSYNVAGFLDNFQDSWAVFPNAQTNTWRVVLGEDVTSRNVELNVVCLPQPAGSTLSGLYQFTSPTGAAGFANASNGGSPLNTFCWLAGTAGDMGFGSLNGGATVTPPIPGFDNDWQVGGAAPGNEFSAVGVCLTFNRSIQLSRQELNATDEEEEQSNCIVDPSGWVDDCVAVSGTDNTWTCAIEGLFSSWNESETGFGWFGVRQSGAITSFLQYAQSAHFGNNNQGFQGGIIGCFK